MISSALVDSAIDKAANLLGVQLFRDATSGDEFDFSIRLVAFPSPKGFTVRVADDYMSWSAHVVLDDFSRKLANLLGERAQLKKEEFDAAVSVVERSTQSCEIIISGSPLGEAQSTEAWTDFEIKLSLSFSLETQLERLVETLIYAISLPLTLLQEDPIDDVTLGEVNSPRLEGDKSSVLQNKYERSRFNRAMCLRHHGFSCKACGEKLVTKYGSVAQELIHVHHIKPVSALGGASYVDPINDLVPLCPNCHNVIHRVNPPLSLEQLVQGILDAKSDPSQETL